MGTKERLLALLEGNQGNYLSGEHAAQTLGVSRTAVWKATKSLREQGLNVEAVTGSGYRLARGSDWLDQSVLIRYMTRDYPASVFDEVDSTNLTGKRWAIENAPHGAMVVAQRQTAGRGRLGRCFESPQGGLYLSIILRPRRGDGTAALITAAAAVAVCQSVSELCGLELSIKWVNDLFINGKKCCGILTEAGTNMENGSIEYMVVGIGINYTTPLQNLGAAQDVAISLYPGDVAPVTRAQLAGDIHHRLLAAFDKLEEREFLSEYKKRNFVLGRMVTVMDSCPYMAKAIDIDRDAHLVVETTEGTEKTISYGEISVKASGNQKGGTR